MKNVKVAGIQFDIVVGNKNANISKALKWLDKAAEEKADIACLSEYFSTGYIPEKFAELAESIPGSTTAKLAEKCKEHEMYVVAPMVERENNKFYSTCALVSPKGTILGKYRKIHLWVLPPREEYKTMTPGKEYPVFETEFGTIGMMIDADLDFPEVARILTLKGAEIIFWPAYAEYMYINSCRYLSFARAFDNVVYLVAVNRIGTYSGYTYFGGSEVVSPLGEIRTSIGDREGMITVSIDLNELRRWRKEIWSSFQRFHPETYTELKSLLLGLPPQAQHLTGA